MENTKPSIDHAAVRIYADRFASALERIGAALERRNTLTEMSNMINNPPPLSANDLAKTHAAPAAEAHTLAAASAAPRAAAVIDLVTQIPYDTVRKAVLAYQDAKGVHAAQEVLKGFGVKYINELKARPERYQEVLDKLK